MARIVDVVADFIENGERCLAVAIPTTVQDKPVMLEVIGRVQLSELEGLSTAAIKRALVKAAKAALAENEPATVRVSPGAITGKVDVD